MLGLPLTFGTPIVLLALGLLPVLWWLLRLIPPRPLEVVFPPAGILRDLRDRKHQPSACPWWLMALRLSLAGLVILALAGPVWQPDTLRLDQRQGPVFVVVDNTWSAAGNWDEVRAVAQQLIDLTQTQNRPVALVTTTAGEQQVFSPQSAHDARQTLLAMTPHGYAPDRLEIAGALNAALRRHPEASLYWLSDGIDHGNGAQFADRLHEAIPASALHVYYPKDPPPFIRGLTHTAQALKVRLMRVSGDAELAGTVLARDRKNRPIARMDWQMGTGETEKTVSFALPGDVRNDIAQIALSPHRTAAGVWLMDGRWKRRRVGMVAGRTAQNAQPLLAPLYYVERALSPYADLYEARAASRAAAITELLDMGIAVLVLSDVGGVSDPVRARLEDWIKRGGILIRFAGPRLAGAEATLLPVDLRRGGRVFGGALSWSTPQSLAGFAQGGPLEDLDVPEDVQVLRQVLAEPTPALRERTWAHLADGTPLITARNLGAGHVVLFHVSSDSSWSNLPLSGVFVHILRRMITLAPGAQVIAGERIDADGRDDAATAVAAPRASSAPPQQPALAPLRTLDGFGVLGSPPASALAIAGGEREQVVASRAVPPGLYGTAEALLALNTLDHVETVARLGDDLVTGSTLYYRASQALDLTAWILAAALVLFLLDMLALAWISGGLRRSATRRAATAALVWIGVLCAGVTTLATMTAMTTPAGAQSRDSFAMRATLDTRLAYVITGDAEVDRVSERGLAGLSLFLTRHTSLEPKHPMGVDLERDELAFFPLLYWPISPTAAEPSVAALANLETFMKQGGTVLIDTRDQFEFRPGGAFSGSGTAAVSAMRKILASLNIPELEPVPTDHVLTKAFYLLQTFPGRWDGSALWVEVLARQTNEDDNAPRPARGGDGVSPILITANDFAGAWAIDENGFPLLSTSPADPWQRELAFRAGVNIVMYTLTGNYKADQVHVPDLLLRLGQ